eukprot:3798549-Amphidinium_carterae.1
MVSGSEFWNVHIVRWMKTVIPDKGRLARGLPAAPASTTTCPGVCPSGPATQEREANTHLADCAVPRLHTSCWVPQLMSTPLKFRLTLELNSKSIQHVAAKRNLQLFSH